MPADTKYDELKSLKIERPDRGDRPPKWSKRFILIGISLLAVVAVITMVYRVLSPAAMEVAAVRAIPENTSSIPVVLNASGYIVAHHKINVNSKVTGRIAWIGVEKGDKVKQGQVLVRLEDQEFKAQVEQARGAVVAAGARLKALETGSRPQEIAEALHNLEQARANLINAKATLDRTRDLVAQGVFTRQQLDDAVGRYDSTQEQVNSLQKVYELVRIGPRQEDIDQARGQLVQARGELDYAQTLRDATLIRAPVNGTILERTAEKGELVTAQFASGAEGGPRGSVVTLADLNDLQVELDISQDDFARIGPKQRGVVTTDAYPDRKYEGVIDEISPEANRQKATVQVKVKILKPDDYLRPEMNAKVAFLPDTMSTPSNQALTGVVVPSAAVRDRDGKKIVWIAFEGKALAREVRVTGRRSNGVVVEGLTGGENVIVNAPASLKEGDRVRLKETQ
ncbi:MAG: efflux RND transporter periplasmic adaptor subunit [Acidobacteriia bacterium]|nr:efflux RND transporter periplasmic adaptor subunit [Terriglobia bacterium]